MAIIVPISALVVGINFEAYILAILMLIYEVVFSLVLAMEVKKIDRVNA